MMAHGGYEEAAVERERRRLLETAAERRRRDMALVFANLRLVDGLVAV
jgi:hypothetical protein